MTASHFVFSIAVIPETADKWQLVPGTVVGLGEHKNRMLTPLIATDNVRRGELKRLICKRVDEIFDCLAPPPEKWENDSDALDRLGITPADLLDESEEGHYRKLADSIREDVDRNILESFDLGRHLTDGSVSKSPLTEHDPACAKATGFAPICECGAERVFVTDTEPEEEILSIPADTLALIKSDPELRQWWKPTFDIDEVRAGRLGWLLNVQLIHDEGAPRVSQHDLLTRIGARGPIPITFIINGEDVLVYAHPEEPISLPKGRALLESRNTGRPPDEWEVRDYAGQRYEDSSTVAEMGLVPTEELVAFSNKNRIFLTLRIGFGG